MSTRIKKHLNNLSAIATSKPKTVLKLLKQADEQLVNVISELALNAELLFQDKRQSYSRNKTKLLRIASKKITLRAKKRLILANSKLVVSLSREAVKLFRFLS